MDCSNPVLLNINWISWHKLKKANSPWFFQLVFIETKVGLKIMQKVFSSLLMRRFFDGIKFAQRKKEKKNLYSKVGQPK